MEGAREDQERSEVTSRATAAILEDDDWRKGARSNPSIPTSSHACPRRRGG